MNEIGKNIFERYILFMQVHDEIVGQPFEKRKYSYSFEDHLKLFNKKLQKMNCEKIEESVFEKYLNELIHIGVVKKIYGHGVDIENEEELAKTRDYNIVNRYPLDFAKECIYKYIETGETSEPVDEIDYTKMTYVKLIDISRTLNQIKDFLIKKVE